MTISKRILWWLLIPAGIALLLIAVPVWTNWRQQTAIAHIERLNGRVVTTHGGPDWLRRLTGDRSLSIFEQATLVNLSHTDINNRDLRHLKRLNGLQRLNLSGTGITDDGLRHLEGLYGLKALDLSDTLVSGSGLKHIRNLTTLRYLYLSRTQIDDADLQHLTRLNRLRHLDVSGTSISANGIAGFHRNRPSVHVVRSP